MRTTWTKAGMKAAGVILILTSIYIGKLADEQHSRTIGILCLVVLVSGIIAFGWGEWRKSLRSPEERKQYAAVMFGFWPGVNKTRQTLEIFAWLLPLIGGPLLALYALEQYPVVDERVFYGFPILMVIVIIICSKFPYFFSSGPMVATGFLKFMVLFSMTMMVSFLCYGTILWANGSFDQSEEVRGVIWTDKKSTQGKAGKKPQYFVIVQSWHDSSQELKLSITKKVYDGLKPGSPVVVTIGKGALYIEWIRSIDNPP